MSILTLNSTFNDIKNLLKDEDICFKKTIEKTFEKVSKDEERKNAFCFFMAMALGGVGTLGDKYKVVDNSEIQSKFLDIVGISGDDWSRYTRKFVQPSKDENLRGDYNNCLSGIHNSSLKDIYVKGIESLKYGNGLGLFDEKDWYFATQKAGEEKKLLLQMV